MIGNQEKKSTSGSSSLDPDTYQVSSKLLNAERSKWCCAHCPAKCLYRSEVQSLLTQKNREWISTELTSQSHITEADRYNAVAKAATHIVWSWLDGEPGATLSKTVAGIAYCAMLHTLADSDYTVYEQALLGGNLQTRFFDQG